MKAFNSPNRASVSDSRPKRLEIGPGTEPLSGFETLDCTHRVGITYCAKWGEDRLPVADESYDEVYASHVLEHVPWHQTAEALREVLRILRPGGAFEVWVPDFAYLVRCYEKRICGDGWRRYNPSADPMVWLNGRVFTYGPGEDNWLRACFDEPFLRQCLQQTGFVNIVRIGQRRRGVSHGPIDLGMMAEKDQ